LIVVILQHCGTCYICNGTYWGLLLGKDGWRWHWAIQQGGRDPALCLYRVH